MPTRSPPRSDVIGAHAFGAQRAHRRVADRVLRQPRDVVAVEAELRQADRDVRFAAAEGGHERGDCSRRSNPGGLSRSMISPNVTTLGMAEH